MQIYLDESEGDYLVIAAVCTEEPKKLAQIMRRAKKAKLPRKTPRPAEVKAGQATDKFKSYFYRHLVQLKEPKLYGIYLKKADIPAHLKGQEGLIYLRMVISLLKKCSVTRHQQVYVIPDKRSLKAVSQEAFITTLKQHFGVTFKRPARFEVFPRHSHEDEGLQVADFVAHAFFQKYQRGNTQWYDLIKSLVRQEIDAAKIL